MLLGVPQSFLKRFLAAEDKLIVSKRGGEHPHPILLEKPGVLERAAGRAVQDRHVNLEIAGCIERGHD
jgi:hypothetical protein